MFALTHCQFKTMNREGGGEKIAQRAQIARCGMAASTLIALGTIALGIITILGQFNLSKVMGYVVGGTVALVGLIALMSDVTAYCKYTKKP